MEDDRYDVIISTSEEIAQNVVKTTVIYRTLVKATGKINVEKEKTEEMLLPM